MQFTRCWLNGEGSVRLNKINVEFKIYWAAALQWDDILLAKKGETKKKIMKLQAITNYRLENYIRYNIP